MSTIEWSGRARISRTPISRQRRIESKSHPWALIEVRGEYGHYWLAVRRLPGGGEFVKSRHPTRRTAEAACLLENR
jgi:hypothetical protein